jgi:hypothetical protein
VRVCCASVLCECAVRMCCASVLCEYAVCAINKCMGVGGFYRSPIAWSLIHYTHTCIIALFATLTNYCMHSAV